MRFKIAISKMRTPGLLLIFFFSGAAGLIYEISWSRQIGLLFGHTAQASAVTLFSYFSGMAVGCFAGSRFLRYASPLRAYSLCELSIALWACIIPIILLYSETPAVAEWLTDTSWPIQTGKRVAFAFMLLLPATVCFGATLPLMAAALSSNRQSHDGDPQTDRVSSAYALNTFGGFLGVLAATFCLLPYVGVRSSGYIGAAISTACGLLAGILSLTERTKPCINRHSATADVSTDLEGESDSLSSTQRYAREGEVISPQGERRIRYLAAALSGFGTMSLEVLSIRQFSLVFHNSTYTFGVVIAVFLAALAFGAYVTSRLPPMVSLREYAGWITGLGAVLILVSPIVFVQITNLEYFSYGETFRSYLCGVFLLVGVVIGPPIACLGMLLPLAWRGSRREADVSFVGRLTAINAICSALSIATTSFVILPWLGLWVSFALIGGCFITLSLFLFWRQRQKLFPWVCGITCVALATYIIVSPFDSRTSATDPELLVRRWQSPYGVIDVVRRRDTGSIKLRQNLHYRYGESKTAEREARQAHIPLLLHPRPTNVLFLGLGTGLTAGGAIPHDLVEQIEIVELIPEVVAAARYLGDFNHGVVDHPKVEIRVDDARHALLATPREYDVIVSDLFVPWESETGYLYTVEHYRTARTRLKSGGIFCQWIPLYQLGAEDFESIAESFASVFPRTTVWWGNLDSRQPILALIGAESSIEVDVESLSLRLARLRSAIGTQDTYLATAELFESLYAGDWKSGNSEFLNTDEHPRVEFFAPISHRDRRLLHDASLKTYFDSTLLGLEDRNVRFRSTSERMQNATAEQRASIRYILFGE